MIHLVSTAGTTFGTVTSAGLEGITVFDGDNCDVLVITRVLFTDVFINLGAAVGEIVNTGVMESATVVCTSFMTAKLMVNPKMTNSKKRFILITLVRNFISY